MIILLNILYFILDLKLIQQVIHLPMLSSSLALSSTNSEDFISCILCGSLPTTS